MTLAKRFNEIRTRLKLSRQQVAIRAGLERTSIWKIESEKFVPKGPTLQKACIKGLGLKKGSAEYEELISLWTSQRIGQDVSAQALAGHMATNFLKNNTEMEQFLLTVAKLPKEAWGELNKAVRRPAVLKGLAALNVMFEDGEPKGRKKA